MLTKVFVIGFGCTGSSVAVDLLAETSCSYVFPDEWDLFRQPDLAGGLDGL